MAMDPNKNNNSSNQNNRNRQLTPGASSRATHLSPPVTGGQSIFLLSRDLPMLHRCFEDMIRRCVREEFHKKYHYFNLPPRLLPDPNIQARYRLQFINKVKSPTFTTDLVRDDNGDLIKVEIYDTYTRSKVSPGSLLASAKVRITVLDAEFWKNKGVNWRRSEFIQSMLREREGKGTILTGPDLIIRLENGVGTFGNIVFNDNSKWTKSGFQLGVMFEGDGEEGYLNGERVREGVSESIRVKDRRGKAIQKPDRLELKHGVQCLKKVGKDRASLLQSNNIITVEDFLCRYYNNEPALREVRILACSFYVYKCKSQNG
ncbi:calmodulin-binding protein 60 B-like [Carex rostrata]